LFENIDEAVAGLGLKNNRFTNTVNLSGKSQAQPLLNSVIVRAIRILYVALCHINNKYMYKDDDKIGKQSCEDGMGWISEYKT
jgi:hypothetical protein